ncbi:hypothetical protein [Thermoactinomyces mirandus]|uniref:Uncharacterized protein n=1 Tax=Thermoactinomyces mirandus TaxID=2756294 RepID=A0A7W1XRM5_9BACL|nr:hypothetical protein [Thermoactinomyces mirandus]MBA4602038.1 hypothetical protein [Thermoactinomyces mirandus]
MMIILSIILLIGAFTVFYQLSIRSDVMEVELTNIEVYPLKEFAETEGSLNNYSLSEKEKEEIMNNLDNYKIVIYDFEIRNNSRLVYSVHHRVQPLFSEETKKILVISDKQLLFPQNIPPGESYGTGLTAILKTDNQLSDQEILDIVSKDRITIIGDRVGIFSAKPVGDESVTVGPFQKDQ